jgi:hypothetical protein
MIISSQKMPMLIPKKNSLWLQKSDHSQENRQGKE